MSNRITAVFDDRNHAEMAINELRNLGVTDAQLSYVSRDDTIDTTGANTTDAAGDVTKGTLAGAGVGALFGIGAALIPGVGPFITAGTLLSSVLGAIGGGAAAGAIVGGTTGLVASALARAGYEEPEARYYGEAVERGGILVAVESPLLDDATVRNVLERHGGRTAALSV
jgi:hypothetical protein